MTRVNPIQTSKDPNPIDMLKPSSSEVEKVYNKVNSFIQRNAGSLFVYAAIWAGFIVCTSILNGRCVAISLLTGMGPGFIWGGIIGTYCVTIFDPDNKYWEFNTFWGAASTIIRKIDNIGTRQIVSHVAIPVFFIAAGVFPYAAGAVLGALIGNRTIARIGFGVDFEIFSSLTTNDEENEGERINNLESELKNLKALIETKFKSSHGDQPSEQPAT